MSARFIRVIAFLFVIGLMFWASYAIIGKVGTGHPKIDTAGKIVYLFDAGNTGKPHVWIIGSDGSGAKDLTPGAQVCADPVFSPDGSQIAYISDKDGSAQVYVMDADGRSAHAVTFGSAAKESPEFSPDGTTLAYLTQGTLTALDLQSKDTQLLLPPPTNATSSATSALIDVTHAPVIKYSWAPGTGGNTNRPAEIAAVQDSEDGGVQILALLPTLNGDPKYMMAASNISVGWSADGSQLYVALLGTKVGPQHAIFSGVIALTPSGGTVQTPPLAATGSGTIGPADPVLSPDGKQIMFSLLGVQDLANARTIGVYIQPADSSAPPKRLFSGPAIGGQWAPDGSRILLLVPTPGSKGRDLFVTKLDGSSSPLDLTKGGGNVTSANWSPSLPAATS